MSVLRRALLPALMVLVACKSSGPKPKPGMDMALAGPASLPSMMPLVGFMPLPDDTNNPSGSTDFESLFAADAPWSQAMGKIGFFGLFGNWVNFDTVTAERLKKYVTFLNAHGLPIGTEMAMINDAPQCAMGVEGVFTPKWAADAAQRIHDAGGALRIMRADDPWSSELLAGNPCKWTAADVAQHLATTAAQVRVVEPQVHIEVTETLQPERGATQQQLLDEVDAFAVAAGRKLDGFVLDIDYSRPKWGPEAIALESAIKSRGIRFGVVYHGADTDADDAAWSATAESRFFDYELLYGGKPDQVMLESWMHLPMHVLPETQAGTFTNLVDRYFRPRPTLTAAVGGATLAGKLTAADGTPIANAAIDATITLVSGNGAPAHFTASGTIPSGATQAVVGIRVNEECNGCNGNADFYVYSANFTVGGSSANLVADGDFSTGVWYAQGSGSVSAAPSDQGAGQMMHVTATPAQMELSQPSPIAVTAGQTYRADFYARIPPATVGSGLFVVIFVGGGNEASRVNLPFAAATSTASGVTDGGGAYSIALAAPPTEARVDVWYRGDDTRFAAHASP